MNPALHPIVRVHVTPRFQTSLRKLPPDVQRLASEKDLLFRANPFDGRLKTHALKGKLRGLWSYSVDYHYRILFEFLPHHEVLYHDIGSHDIYH